MNQLSDCQSGLAGERSPKFWWLLRSPKTSTIIASGNWLPLAFFFLWKFPFKMSKNRSRANCEYCTTDSLTTLPLNAKTKFVPRFRFSFRIHLQVKNSGKLNSIQSVSGWNFQCAKKFRNHQYCEIALRGTLSCVQNRCHSARHYSPDSLCPPSCHLQWSFLSGDSSRGKLFIVNLARLSGLENR